ncbi:XVIPCD domain-containing protein [Xanthomonas euvesicatoria]|uniref:XVIPCD domain-containing protein n=1 Tax=Xanthomonas euvesicatoria TaxID=456327 RepID=UPI0031B9C411
MWEEQAQSTAEKILDETMDRTTGRVKIESNWARVNIERDPATGLIKGEPEIEKWKTPLERQQDRQLERSLRQETQGQKKTPVDADHQDFALHQQIKGKVAELDVQNGRTFDAVSERMTASLLALAKDNGLTRVDHVLLSKQTDSLPAAQNVFVVQGSLNDPAMLRAYMPTAQAQTPVEQSFSQLEQVNQRLAQQLAQQQTLDQTQAQSQGAPQMRMS